jgi:hypothetical protein
MASTTYQEFLQAKTQLGGDHGFEPVFLPDELFDFQRALVQWAIRKGRAALFEDCGLGKTYQQLVWAENVVRHTNRPVLILTPLAVGQQTVREAEKFGLEAIRSQDGKYPDRACIVVTNYERLNHFNRHHFSGTVCDESSVLKNFDGKRKAEITEFMREQPYRLLCTATAAPNDFIELGTSAEALGEMGFQDMITRFFIKETRKDYLGWGRTKYRMRSHAERDFWRWVCSWARACRKPSDLGFDDGPFLLPDLIERQYEVKARQIAPGFLFEMPAETLQEQQQETRRTLEERCENVARLVNDTGQPAIAWCHLNDEGDLLEKLIPDAIQVSGSDSDSVKEDRLIAFATGKVRVLVSKPEIAGFGLNFQHCAHQTFFPSHSFERFYQAVRRSWRFGQTRPVIVDIVTTEGGSDVLDNLRRKATACEQMFSRMVELMHNSMVIPRGVYGTEEVRMPDWLS